MTSRATVRGLRILLSLLFALLAITILAVGLAARLAPLAGYELFAIRSGSMQPAIPVGSLVVIATAPEEPIAAGEAVAYRLPNGAVVTHRVVERVDAEAGSFLQTKGDANADPDPSLVPAEWVIGPARLTIPWLGFLLALLGMPIGVVTILSVAGTLVTALWLLEELELLDDRETTEPMPEAVPERGAGQ